jgi:type I restriction-modification system DNA methylase subunit
MKELFYLVSKLHMNGTETLTPPELVEEMLDRLPPEIWSDPSKTFLDPVMGTGTFYLCLLRRLDAGLKEVIPDRNERLRHIMANQLFGCEIDRKQLRRFKASLYHLGIEQFERNVYNEDSLQKEWDMKFDVVVGNPPYQAPKGYLVQPRYKVTDGRWGKKQLYYFFSQYALEIADRCVFVMPTAWMRSDDAVNLRRWLASENIKVVFPSNERVSHILGRKKLSMV